ncbi:MAG: helix-turn-helix transcriptional regulator [Sphingomonas sp.]
MATHVSEAALPAAWHLQTTGDASFDWHSVLEAAGELLDAASVDLVALQDDGRTIEQIAAWARDDRSPVARANSVEAAVLASADFARIHRWRAGPGTGDTAPGGRRAAPLAVALAVRGAATFFLVADLAHAGRRHQAMANLPSVVELVRHSFAQETRLLAAERERAAATAALDQDSSGIIVVAADGRPLVMNRAADAMLSRGDVLQLAHNAIRPTHYPDVMRFHAALDMVTQQSQRHEPNRREAAIILLDGNGLGTPVVASMVPADPMPPGTDGAVIIHLVRREDTVEGLTALCRLFGLSPVEAKLAEHLYRGATVAQAAATMQIKIETARSYLKQIFAKTDAHRQADLLAMLSQYSRIIGGRFQYRSL